LTNVNRLKFVLIFIVNEFIMIIIILLLVIIN